jgi:SAM-dependent methyltransferase
MNNAVHLDSPERVHFIRSRIEEKRSLKAWYRENYEKFKAVVALCPPAGVVLEIGSGGGFLKEVVPETQTSDILAYEDMDLQVDATRLPFQENSVRAVFMLNVFHHIPDVAAFLRECERCLVPGGRVFIVDQYPGLIGGTIYRHFHHEPFVAETEEWRFQSSGALSSANGALAWMVFERDRKKFETLYKTLRIARFEPHSPLRYWLTGGLKNWSLLPKSLFSAATRLDSLLIKTTPKFGSFVDIEIVKQ